MSWLSISRANFPGSGIASSVAAYMTTIPDSPERVSAPEDVPGLADFKGSVGGSGFSEYPALVRGFGGRGGSGQGAVAARQNHAEPGLP